MNNQANLKLLIELGIAKKPKSNQDKKNPDHKLEVLKSFGIKWKKTSKCWFFYLWIFLTLFTLNLLNVSRILWDFFSFLSSNISLIWSEKSLILCRMITLLLRFFIKYKNPFLILITCRTFFPGTTVNNASTIIKIPIMADHGKGIIIGIKASSTKIAPIK